jgi:putative tricarboxylic transport membrane protein
MAIRDGIIGLISLLFGAFIVYLTLDFPSLEGGHPGPALFPRILAFLFSACGAAMILSDIRARKPKPGGKAFFPGWGPTWNALSVIAVVIMYTLIVDALGFILTGTVLFCLLMMKLGVRTLSSVVLSVALTVGVYLLFHKLLMVPLPWGLIHW